ncbi:hypothetical protein OAS39_00105 [Pirellulales bacterium]|nr:hypothetical protein [Pirellulales bacterium]
MSLTTQEAVETNAKYREVLQIAEKLYRQSPDWITFFREVLGIDGVVRKAFPNHEALAAFEQGDEFERIHQMLVKLREKRITADAEVEPTRVITVRLPKSMHEYLRTEAHDLRTSMNKLCISKLLQVIAEDKIPNERTGNAKSSGGGNGQPVGTPPGGSLPRPQPTPGLSVHTPPPFKPTTPRF